MEAEAGKGRLSPDRFVKAFGAYSHGHQEPVKMFNYSGHLGSGAPFISHELVDLGHLTHLCLSLTSS